MTFDLFWSLYPRRVVKRAAVKAWDKEMRNGTSPDEIINGLRRQLPHLTARDVQFIPHPSTWLNQGRWEDEIPEQAAAKPEPRKSAYREHQDACARELDKIINRDAGHDEHSDRPNNVIDIGTADYRVERKAASRW